MEGLQEQSTAVGSCGRLHECTELGFVLNVNVAIEVKFGLVSEEVGYT
jgi:hypothetical protein